MPSTSSPPPIVMFLDHYFSRLRESDDDEDSSQVPAPGALNVPVEAPRTTLLNVPAEIQRLIATNLSELDSTCLGLTCKKMYEVHLSLHQRPIRLSDIEHMGLFRQCKTNGPIQYVSRPRYFFDRLTSWYGHSHVYCWNVKKLVKHERKCFLCDGVVPEEEDCD